MIDLVMRPAVPTDLPLIHAFSRLIAEEAGDEAHFHATTEDLERALFGEPPTIECALAHCEGEAVGCAIFFSKFSSYTGRTEIYLEDLVVSRSARSGGVGIQLLAHVSRIALERGASHVEWFVDKANTRGIEFYERHGANAVDSVAIMRLSGEALRDVARRID